MTLFTTICVYYLFYTIYSGYSLFPRRFLIKSLYLVCLKVNNLYFWYGQKLTYPLFLAILPNFCVSGMPKISYFYCFILKLLFYWYSGIGEIQQTIKLNSQQFIPLFYAFLPKIPLFCHINYKWYLWWGGLFLEFISKIPRKTQNSFMVDQQIVEQ